MQAAESYWSGRAVLVTGCAGFLGSWLCRTLLRSGSRLTGVDVSEEAGAALRRRLPELGEPGELPGERKDTEAFSYRAGQLEDYEFLKQTLAESEAGTVMHLAGQSQVGVAARFPRETFESNIRGTWNLLEAARQTQRPVQVILASSESVYGEPGALPFTEEMPLAGRHPYDASKIAAELLGQTYQRSYGLAVCATRASNLYGGGDGNFGRLIPGTIRSVLRGERPQIRSDGQAARDYLYIEDAVRGYLALAESMQQPDIAGEAFNLCGERPVSTLEVVDTILELMGRKDLSPEILNQPSNEPPLRYSSGRKAQERLGWSAQFSLKDGLRRTIQWYERSLARLPGAG